MKIQNMTSNCKMWIVARECDGEWWYYGSFDENNRANAVAQLIGGVVFFRDDID